MRLYLVRHPKPQVGSGVCYGQTDLSCAPDVLHTAAQALHDALPQGLAMISSPLQRCEQLALILSGLAPDFAYKNDARLAEMHFGNWEMKRWDAIAASELKAWTDDFAHYRCGGSGESTAAMVTRVAQRLMESARSGQDQIWITHAGVIRTLLWLQAQPVPWLQTLFTALAHRPALEQGQPQVLSEAWLLGGEASDFWRDRLHARAWSQAEIAFGQVQTWDWPQAWHWQSQGPLQARQR
jgi:alpha-ribazole phosphatase